MQVFNSKARCINCRKAAKKHVKSYSGYEPYKGNLRVIRDRSYSHPQINGGATRYDLSLWDGQSYVLRAGKFCTNRCAIEWANKHAPNPQEVKGD